MTKKYLFIFANILFIFISSQAFAVNKCDISQEKKDIILSLLCGKFSKEKEYQTNGTGCAIISLNKRLEDSAIQIYVYKVCGEENFSEELKNATLLSIKFIEDLLPCIDEKINLVETLNEKLKQVSSRIGNDCPNYIKSKLASRKPYFEQMIKMSKQPNSILENFDKIGIKYDKNHNIVESKRISSTTDKNNLNHYR